MDFVRYGLTRQQWYVTLQSIAVTPSRNKRKDPDRSSQRPPEVTSRKTRSLCRNSTPSRISSHQGRKRADYAHCASDALGRQNDRARPDRNINAPPSNTVPQISRRFETLSTVSGTRALSRFSPSSKTLSVGLETNGLG